MKWTFHQAWIHLIDGHETNVVFSTTTRRVASMHFANMNVNELPESVRWDGYTMCFILTVL